MSLSLTPFYGFISRDGVTVSLDSVLDADSRGWHIRGASAINNDGAIAATGSLGGGPDRALLLIPNR